MRSLAVTSFTSNPANYKLIDLPIPVVFHPKDILVKVHAASLNFGDIQLARGALRILETQRLPWPLGLDFAGTVQAVGSFVTKFQPGDRIFGFVRSSGTASEFLLLSPDVWKVFAKMPPGMSFADAASLPSVALTALKAFTDADAKLHGGLKGKTVFVPAALSGTGSIGVQLAKHVFGAAKVITTVSTAKIPRVTEFLGEDTVDQIIDYTAQNPVQIIARGTVDFLFETMHMGMPYLSTVKPRTGLHYSIFTIPPSKKMKFDWPKSPWLMRVFLDVVDRIYRIRAWWWDVQYEHVHVVPNPSGLEQLAELFSEGKIKAVVGRRAKLDDLEEIQAACRELKAGKRGVGKFVIEMV